MSETNNPQPADPPVNTGGTSMGGGSATAPEPDETVATDPPENSGGGTYGGGWE